MSDIIDVLTGIESGSSLDAIRRTREQARQNAQRSFEVLFEPAEPGTFSLAERYAVSAYTVALQASASPAAAFYTELLEDEVSPELAAAVAELAERDRRAGPYGEYQETGLAAESVPGPTVSYAQRPNVVSERLAAALEHAHLLSLHPRDAEASHLRRLEEAGWNADDIVTLSQLISFLAFQIRVVDGLLALKGAA
ncbi:CMD domain protein [Yaniella halotolerans]|uniref:CMD domain protein n=1 Tax=Yaniella halotolerans TaxID=225453 RepID=UPI000418496B|nr:CMD domain protein [Yaniella halotolerans]